MSRPRILDLYCGAGGAAVGYYRAGFDVVGVDIKPQKHYPFEFIQADALEFLDAGGAEGFDAIHASPPCQGYSNATPMWARANHPKVIKNVSSRLVGRMYVIENVAGARRELIDPLLLCGTMFGLPLWRHRYFELGGVDVWSPFSCNHERRPIVLHAGSNSRKLGPVLVTGSTRRKTGRFDWAIADCRIAMDINWMTRKELDEAIPPAYTEYIGRHLIEVLP